MRTSRSSEGDSCGGRPPGLPDSPRPGPTAQLLKHRAKVRCPVRAGAGGARSGSEGGGRPPAGRRRPRSRVGLRRPRLAEMTPNHGRLLCPEGVADKAHGDGFEPWAPRRQPAPWDGLPIRPTSARRRPRLALRAPPGRLAVWPGTSPTARPVTASPASSSCRTRRSGGRCRPGRSGSSGPGGRINRPCARRPRGRRRRAPPGPGRRSGAPARP